MADLLAKLTRDQYGFFHFDLMGFIRFGVQNRQRLQAIDDCFQLVQAQGGNLFVPAYSYSYTKKEDYSLKDSVCTLGPVFDFLRQKNSDKRTVDAIFSYLAFSQSVERKHFLPQNYESFGRDSLIGQGFHGDAWILTVGGKMHFSTELHYIEKLLNVPYRFDKVFSGTLIDHQNQRHPQEITYFCRDLAFAEKEKVEVSFERLVADLQERGIVRRYEVEGEFALEMARLSDIYEIVKKALIKNPLYLMKRI